MHVLTAAAILWQFDQQPLVYRQLQFIQQLQAGIDATSTVANILLFPRRKSCEEHCEIWPTHEGS